MPVAAVDNFILVKIECVEAEVLLMSFESIGGRERFESSFEGVSEIGRAHV